MVIFGLASLERRTSGSVPWLIRELGEASYVLYLMHFLAISVIAKILSLGPDHAGWTAAAFALTIMLCSVAAIIFYRLVEKPLLRFLRGGLTARVDALAAQRNPTAASI